MELKNPEDCDRGMEKAIIAQDLEAAVALYAANAVFVADGNKLVSGIAAIRETIRPSMKLENFRFTKLESFTNEDAGIALLIGEWAGTSRGEDGTTQDQTGRNVEVVQRQPDGTWRFVIDHPTGAN